jgi:hypothetical protein
MTDATWAIQISPKLPDGTLINVRADSPDQMEQLLAYLEGKGTTIASVVQSLTAQGNVAATFPGSQNVPAPQAPAQPQQGGWPQQSAPPQQQAAPQGGGFGGPPTKYDLSGPPSPAPQCQHGLMEWRHRTSQKGSEYKGWFCPSKNKDQQCQAQFLR